MKTLVDITEPQLKGLEEIARAKNQSRAAVIRAAIDDFLKRRKVREDDDAFGLWGASEVDGLDYQEKIRREW
jgi:predicted transcriptional regulator